MNIKKWVKSIQTAGNNGARTVSGSTEFVSKQPTQLIVEPNSSLRHIIVTYVLTNKVDMKTPKFP